jgi:hypothetical protein
MEQSFRDPARKQNRIKADTDENGEEPRQILNDVADNGPLRLATEFYDGGMKIKIILPLCVRGGAIRARWFRLRIG